METGIIYLASSKTTGKYYVGQTIEGLRRRTMNHKNKSRKIQTSHKFYNAINKYGFNDFNWFILMEAPQDELNALEILIIGILDTYENGYNSTRGGDTTFGYKHSEETKLKVSEHHADVSGKNNPMFGKRRTKEEKLKMGENRCKNNYKITEPDGNILIIKNLRRFCRENKLTRFYMYQVANGKKEKYKSYKCERLS